jgi:formate hydrogenlyase subunit 3/multisubunit Na+/H+ antiporter MnhD subunit
MTPLSFEWQWNVDYIIFMGLLYMVLIIIGCALIYTLVKTLFDLDAEGKEPPPEIESRSKYSEY